jgi:DNA repair exonuclease SbcCD ATPase subunit
MALWSDSAPGETHIRGLGPGVNILTAGNEAGKSTLFKAVRACLFERHNTKNESFRNLATDGLSLPITVTLGFEHDGEAWATMAEGRDR